PIDTEPIGRAALYGCAEPVERLRPGAAGDLRQPAHLPPHASVPFHLRGAVGEAQGGFHAGAPRWDRERHHVLRGPLLGHAEAARHRADRARHRIWKLRERSVWSLERGIGRGSAALSGASAVLAARTRATALATVWVCAAGAPFARRGALGTGAAERLGTATEGGHQRSKHASSGIARVDAIRTGHAGIP